MPEIISNISSKYILKMIFAHLNYNKVLKITKYNKEIQTNLGFNFDIFQKWSSYQYYEKTKVVKIDKPPYMDLEGSFNLIFSSLCSLIISIYVLIIASILAAKGAFNDNNTKNNCSISQCHFNLFFLFKIRRLGVRVWGLGWGG